MLVGMDEMLAGMDEMLVGMDEMLVGRERFSLEWTNVGRNEGILVGIQVKDLVRNRSLRIDIDSRLWGWKEERMAWNGFSILFGMKGC